QSAFQGRKLGEAFEVRRRMTGAGGRPSQAEGDELAAVEHPPPDLEGLAELPALARGLPQAPEAPAAPAPACAVAVLAVDDQAEGLARAPAGRQPGLAHPRHTHLRSSGRVLASGRGGAAAPPPRVHARLAP